MNKPEKTFMSVRETARFTGLGEAYIRTSLKQGKVPHVMSGSKALINVPLYLEQLNDSCKSAIG